MKKASKNWKGLHNDNYQSHSLLWSGADGADCGRCFVLDYVDGERRMKPSQEQVLAWYEQANGWSPEGWDKTVKELERFAALAYEAGRKDEREWREHKDLHISFGELLEKAAAQGDKND